MTLEELFEKHGVDPTQWRQVGGRSVEPTLIKQQRKALETIRDLLEEKVAADKRMVLLLRERRMRAKHGGGS
jgi:hypothetical protein